MWALQLALHFLQKNNPILKGLPALFFSIAKNRIVKRFNVFIGTNKNQTKG